jgi:hypothetical protein
MQACCQSVQLPHPPVASQKNNSDASGHEQKLNVSKLLSKMSLRCWPNWKRSGDAEKFKAFVDPVEKRLWRLAKIACVLVRLDHGLALYQTREWLPDVSGWKTLRKATK